jgi:hypothetical protein
MSNTEQQENPVFFAKLNSSLGAILGFCVPKFYQVPLKDVVITAFNEKCDFISIIAYDVETENKKDLLKEVVDNKRELVLLSVKDFFAPPAEEQNTPLPSVPEALESA